MHEGTPAGGATTANAERRAPSPPFVLTDGLEVDVLVPLAGDHLILGGQVVQITDTTVTLRMASGADALAVAAAHRCVVVWGVEGEERCALVRNGHRVDDVRTPTTIELVLEDVRPLAELARARADEDAEPEMEAQPVG